MSIYQQKPLDAAILHVRAGDPEPLDDAGKKLEARIKKLDGLIARYESKLADGIELPPDVKTLIDEMSTEVQDLSAKLVDLAQKSVEQVNQRQADPDRVGAMLARNDDILKQATAIKARKGKMSIDGVSVRNIVSLEGIGATASLAKNDLHNLETPLAFLDLIAFMPVAGDLVPLLRESAYDMMADETDEATEKPESDISFGVENIQMAVVAHWTRITKQLLDDMPALAAYIEGRLAYGVRLKLENKIINGTSLSFSGLMKTGNSVVHTPVSGETAIDTLNAAKYKSFATGLPPEVILLNPLDWGKIERTKGTDGHYIFSNAISTVTPVLWGVPVVLSAAMPAGKYWCGNVTMGVAGYVRQEVTVDLSTEDGDNFTKNLVTIRAEMRAGFGIAVPDAQVSGLLVAPTP